MKRELIKFILAYLLGIVICIILVVATMVCISKTVHAANESKYIIDSSISWTPVENLKETE